MASAIDATKPLDGVPASKSELRANLLAAKNEITALQEHIANLANATGLDPAEGLFPELGGSFTPPGAHTLIEIILAMDTAIDLAIEAVDGGGGGPLTLSDITDILTPSLAQRLAFQNPIGVVTISANTAFDISAHAGRVLSIDASAAAVALTLPATEVLSSRADGWLCSLTVQSSTNFSSVVGPTDGLRIQNDRFGLIETQTTAFLGMSLASSFRAWVDVYKVGSVYSLRGPTRTINSEDVSHGAPGSMPGTAIATGTLLGAAVAAVFNLGGSVIAGGARTPIRAVAGATTLAQTDSGSIVEHTGASPSSWQVPALQTGTSIDMENRGAGLVTLVIQGGQSVTGGLLLPSNGTANALWRSNGSIRLVGTS